MGKRASVYQARALGWVCVPLASWWGKGLPRRRWVAGLRGWSATLGLEHGPDSYGRQQWGILGNGRKPDPATPCEGRRPSGRKPLSVGKKGYGLIACTFDGTHRGSTGQLRASSRGNTEGASVIRNHWA